MGIHNLLPFVKKACRNGNISELSHQSVAVDVSCLLHRGLIGCADKIASGCETDFYIHYVMKYVKALLAIGCHVILVFDGQPLPAKKETNDLRRERRDLHKQKGVLLLSEGRGKEAYDCFKRGASLTKDIMENAIQAFRQLNMVDVIVAPYESDAQLAFFSKTKMAQAVITEDSDLIAFGCEKIIFKMDLSGSCVIFEKKLLPKCLCKALAENFDFDKFRRICILAGCDYLQAGLPGVGINKAAAFFSKTSGGNLYEMLPRLPRYLNMNSLKVSKQFIADFIRAENTFLYQIVFDPVERRQRPLHNYPLSRQSTQRDSDFSSSSQGSSDDDLSYAGEIQSPEVALSLALGNIPGGSQSDHICLPENVPDWSIWSANYRTAQVRQNEGNKSSSCGAFTLSLSAKNCTKRSNELGSGNVYPNLSQTSNSSILDSSSNSTTDNEASISFETVENMNKRNHCKVGNIRSIGALKTGNGARQNWNCDILLQTFASEKVSSSKNISKSQAFLDELPIKKACYAVSCNEFENNDETVDGVKDTSIVTITSAMESASKTQNGSFCSKYFLNKGSKTSGLSRRPVSSLRIEPNRTFPS